MAKQIVYGEQSRQAILRGVNHGSGEAVIGAFRAQVDGAHGGERRPGYRAFMERA